MKIIFEQFLIKTNILDKTLIALIFFLPFLLSISIFLADLFASISALIVLSFFFSKKNRKNFIKIKKETYYFLLFFLFILISLTFSISFKESFLPSFFYFRYFLLAIGIYFLCKKYFFFTKILFFSLMVAFSIIFFDTLIQYSFGNNILNYPMGYDGTNFVTSFFNDEKKLGSFSVRLLPIFLSLYFFLNYKKSHLPILLIFGFIIFLSSERVALFLYLIILFFYFLIIQYKIKFLTIFSIFIFVIFYFNEERKFKYIDYTIQQLGFIETSWNKDYMGKKRYYSKEHEDLSLTALIIFKDNIINGSGIKTFYKACNYYKKKEEENKINYFETLERNNKITCSTHPHNTYIQILSEIGIFGFLMVFYFFLKSLYENLKIIFKKKKLSNIELSFYFINIGIIINLFPLIPSGNFFNNWLSLILFFPLGFWFFLNEKYKEKINHD